MATWTAEEIAALRRGETQIGGRSPKACKAKARREGLLARDGYSETQLAKLLGVNAATVAGWRTQGWLRGALEYGDRGGNWTYSRKHVRSFIAAHPDVIGAMPRASLAWLVGMLKKAA